MSGLGRMGVGRLALLLGGLCLAGCVTGPPVQPPLLQLSRTDCDAKVNLAAALPVRVEDSSGTSAVLGEAGRCLVLPNGIQTSYAVFALPSGTAPYTLEILSSVMLRNLVRPVATLYDEAGQVVRTVPPEEFEFNIRGLRAGVRPHGTERWLSVAADPTLVGTSVELQLGSVEQTVRLAAVVIVPIVVIAPAVPDLVRHRTAVYALNGRITVAAAPARKAQLASLE